MSIIDGDTHAVAATAVERRDTSLYRATGRGRDLLAIDAGTLKVAGSVEVGERPWGVALSPDGRLE